MRKPGFVSGNLAVSAVALNVLLCTSLWGQSSRRSASFPQFASLAPQEMNSQERQGAEEDIDSQPARAFRTAVRDLFNQEKFQQLEEIASGIRAQKERLRGGTWKLHVFYLTVQGPGSLTSTDAAWNAHFERLQRWVAAKPNSITPRVALAQAHLRLAWKARGHGYANTVPPDDWKLFDDHVRQGRDVLEHAEALGLKDAQWYRDMQIVALLQGWERGKIDDLVQKASTFEPGYFYYYDAYANYLLPKWYGKAGESEAFLQSIADKIGGQEGDLVYFMVADDLNCCRPKAQMPNISWDRVKQGFAALEQLYGSTNHQLNAVTYMAVRQGDRDFAQQLFARVGNDWDEEVWRSKQNFTRAKATLSLEQKPQPAQPQSGQ